MKKLLCVLGAVILTAPTTFANAISESDMTSIAMGSERQEIHQKVGEPSAVSGNGIKETYDIDIGKTAVLQYSDDTLCRGFILH